MSTEQVTSDLRQQSFRAAIALNNTAVSFLPRGGDLFEVMEIFNDAVKLMKSSLFVPPNGLTSDEKSTAMEEQIKLATMKACKKGVKDVCFSSGVETKADFEVLTISSFDDPALVLSKINHTSNGAKFIMCCVIIDTVGFDDIHTTETFDLKSAALLYNYGVAHYIVAAERASSHDGTINGDDNGDPVSQTLCERSLILLKKSEAVFTTRLTHDHRDSCCTSTVLFGMITTWAILKVAHQLGKLDIEEHQKKKFASIAASVKAVDAMLPHSRRQAPAA